MPDSGGRSFSVDALLADELRGRLPSVLLGLWRRRGIESLLPLQRRAVRETGLLAGRNLLVVAPSSAGKTLIGELAMARAIGEGRRAILIAPTRALAEQHYAAWEAGLAPLGLRAICATSDRPEADAHAAAGHFDVLVAVPEKLRAYLVTDTRPLAGAGVMVVDEIQTLADPHRGPLLDLLITQVLRSPYAPQVVAMAPELSNAGTLAAWLGAETLEDHARPAPLREGVLDLSDGLFRYHECGPGSDCTGQPGSERLMTPDEAARLEERAIVAAEELQLPMGEETRAILVAAAALARDRGPALLFAPTRPCSRRWAGVLAAMGLGLAPAGIALARLARLADAGRIVDRLAPCLAAGIAFHNADMDGGLRTLVEQAFQAGEIRLLVSTSTLGVGVNLAARTVVHAPWRWGSALESPGANRLTTSIESMHQAARVTAPLPLGRARFINQGGRAGRLGWTTGPGLSVLVARSPGEAERLWDGLVRAAPEALDRPPLGTLTPGEIALGLLAGGAERTATNLSREARATFSAAAGTLTPGIFEPSTVEDGLDALRRMGIVRRAPNAFWGLTRLGESLLRGSLAPASLSEVLLALRDWEIGDAAEWRTPHALLCALGKTAEGELALAGLPFGRWHPPLPLPEGAAEDIPEPSAAPGEAGNFEALRNLPRRAVLAWCAASAMMDWTAGVPTRIVEEKYDLMAGALATAAEAMARVVFSAAAIARTVGSGHPVASPLAELAERMMAGVRADALPLARLRVPGLSRDRVNALAREGLADPERIDAMSEKHLVRHLEPEVAQMLKSACHAWLRRSRLSRLPGLLPAPGGEPSGGRKDEPAGATPTPRQVKIEIDPQSPGFVRAGGREIQLPPLGFDLLMALAERPGEVVTRQALYHRLWPEGGPEDQQLDAHRRRLIGRLRPALGNDAVRVAEVVRGIGFRLTLGETRIRRRAGGAGGGAESGCATVARPR